MTIWLLNKKGVMGSYVMTPGGSYMDMTNGCSIVGLLASLYKNASRIDLRIKKSLLKQVISLAGS